MHYNNLDHQEKALTDIRKNENYKTNPYSSLSFRGFTSLILTPFLTKITFTEFLHFEIHGEKKAIVVDVFFSPFRKELSESLHILTHLCLHLAEGPFWCAKPGNRVFDRQLSTQGAKGLIRLKSEGSTSGTKHLGCIMLTSLC